LLNNYDAILKLENEKKNDTVQTFENEYYYETDLDNTLINLLNEKTSPYEETNKKQVLKILSYFKKYNNVSKDEFNIFISYVYSLNTNYKFLDDKNELYSMFDKLYNLMVNQSDNLIQSLDEVYSKNNYNNIYYSSWADFKSSFSTLANTIAWSVVENEKESGLIQKAIKWSETSLKLEKNNGYYLDTLAQLYYKDGQKELAIKTQKQALEAMKEYQESETYLEMQDVLAKMQNGSY